MSIHPVMQRLADKLRRTDLPEFVPGDTVRVQVKIKEGDKERLQAFEGIVIALKNGAQGSFTVRKMSFGQGVLNAAKDCFSIRPALSARKPKVRDLTNNALESALDLCNAASASRSAWAIS